MRADWVKDLWAKVVVWDRRGEDFEEKQRGPSERTVNRRLCRGASYWMQGEQCVWLQVELAILRQDVMVG